MKEEFEKAANTVNTMKSGIYVPGMEVVECKDFPEDLKALLEESGLCRKNGSSLFGNVSIFSTDACEKARVSRNFVNCSRKE